VPDAAEEAGRIGRKRKKRACREGSKHPSLSVTEHVTYGALCYLLMCNIDLILKNTTPVFTDEGSRSQKSLVATWLRSQNLEVTELGCRPLSSDS